MSALTDVLVIEGPTGIGKTALAIALAERFNGEIVSADSRQIYQKMDIGTAKPSVAELARVPHHLIDIVLPDYALSLAEYQAQATAAIRAIAGRGRLPIVAGGTGQYITALIEGWQTPEVAPDAALRAELEAFSEERGADALYARLLALDPGAEGLIDPRNVRRVIRALEVSIVSGQPFSAQRRKSPPPYRVYEWALTMDRAALDARLDTRIDGMLARGLLAEVRDLLAAGYARKLPSMSGLGYAQLAAYLSGETTYEAAVEAFKAGTRLFARRQYTWFRRHGSPQWIDITQTSMDTLAAQLTAWLDKTPDTQDRLS
jgi:tRNA dimethylallyltransferase